FSFVKKKIIITISDTGYGIPKKEKDKIFTKLYHAENIREKDTDGTGLGLYLVKSVVLQLRGTIRFESKENKGTTFYVTLPLDNIKKEMEAAAGGGGRI
ncbi:MAG: HAMP domain-containing sensor histidine kinase, partial [Candidatus Paceibacterota bacterium]